MAESTTATVRLGTLNPDGTRQTLVQTQVDAVPIAPGLAAHRSWCGAFLPNRYALNHLASGTLLTDRRCINHLHQLASVFAASGIDWTAPLDQVTQAMADANLFDFIEHVTGTHCGGPLCSPMADLPDALKEHAA